jgi:hypothetical protein
MGRVSRTHRLGTTMRNYPTPPLAHVCGNSEPVPDASGAGYTGHNQDTIPVLSYN